MATLTTLLAFALGPMEITLIVLVLIFFFGAKKIPEIARGLGKSVNEFKKGKDEGLPEDDKQHS